MDLEMPPIPLEEYFRASSLVSTSFNCGLVRLASENFWCKRNSPAFDVHADFSGGIQKIMYFNESPDQMYHESNMVRQNLHWVCL